MASVGTVLIGCMLAIDEKQFEGELEREVCSLQFLKKHLIFSCQKYLGLPPTNWAINIDEEHIEGESEAGLVFTFSQKHSLNIFPPKYLGLPPINQLTN